MCYVLVAVQIFKPLKSNTGFINLFKYTIKSERTQFVLIRRAPPQDVLLRYLFILNRDRRASQKVRRSQEHAFLLLAPNTGNLFFYKFIYNLFSCKLIGNLCQLFHIRSTIFLAPFRKGGEENSHQCPAASAGVLSFVYSLSSYFFLSPLRRTTTFFFDFPLTVKSF